MKKNKSEKDYISIIYSLFFCLIPFIYNDTIVDPVLIPRQIFATVFLTILIIFLIFNYGLKNNIPDLNYVRLLLPLTIFVFLLATIFSGFYAMNTTESIYKISKLSVEVVFFFITTLFLIQNKLNLQTVSKSIVIFSAIVVISVVWQIVSLNLKDVNIFNNVSLISSFFANKNLLASIVFLTMPFVFITCLSSKIWKFISLVIYGSELAVILIIQTKAAILAVFISFLIFLIISVKNKKLKSREYPIKPMIFTTIIFLIFFSIIFIITKYDIKIETKSETKIETKSEIQSKSSVVEDNKKISFTHLTNANSAFSRFLLWENSVKMIKENPVGGVGAGNWQFYFPKYGLNKFEEITANGILTYQRPHNDFLWVFCETGITGITAYFLIFLSSVFYLNKLLKDIKTEVLYWQYSALLWGITGYVIIALVDYPFERVEHQFFLMFILSVITSFYFKNIKPETIKVKVKPFILLGFFIVIITFSFTVSINRFIGEKNSRNLYNSHYSANWIQLIKDADNSINNYYKTDPMSTPIEWYKGVALFATGNVDAAKISFEKAYILHPYHIHVINNLASCYEKKGLHDKAIELYKKALTISPNFEETVLNLSAVYFNMKDFEMAFNTIFFCNTNCSDPKYKTFLPAILRAKTNLIIERDQNKLIKNKLIQLTLSPDSLIQIYFQARLKKINFEKYIVESKN